MVPAFAGGSDTPWDCCNPKGVTEADAAAVKLSVAITIGVDPVSVLTPGVKAGSEENGPDRSTVAEVVDLLSCWISGHREGRSKQQNRSGNGSEINSSGCRSRRR